MTTTLTESLICERNNDFRIYSDVRGEEPIGQVFDLVYEEDVVEYYARLFESSPQLVRQLERAVKVLTKFSHLFDKDVDDVIKDSNELLKTLTKGLDELKTESADDLTFEVDALQDYYGE